MAQNAGKVDGPVNAKAVLVDPESMTVVWMNESAAQGVSHGEGESVSAIPVAEVVPMGALLGVEDAVREVAETGVARHLRTDLVSTARGGVEIATSIYRLPDGKVLLLTENAWYTAKDGGAPKRSGRRSR